MSPAEAAHVLKYELGFCCGADDGPLELLRSVLAWTKKERAFGTCPELNVEACSGYPFKKSICTERLEAFGHFMAYWLEHARLLEHGGNCMASWLMKRGEEFLAAIEGKTFEELENALQACHESDDEPEAWYAKAYPPI